jgi:hypothetical protein
MVLYNLLFSIQIAKIFFAISFLQPFSLYANFLKDDQRHISIYMTE